MRSAILSTFLLIYVPDAALATSPFPRDPTKGVCESPASRKQKIDLALEAIGHLTGRIERLSPSDRQYLETETSEALAQQNETRYNLAAGQSTYPAWQVWVEYDAMTGDLRSASESEDPLDTVIGVGRALVRMPDFVENLNTYIDFDRRRPQPAYDASRTSFDKAVFSRVLGGLLECSARAVRGVR